MFYIIIIGAFVIFAFSMRAIFGAPLRPIADKAHVIANATSKLKSNVDMFKTGIDPDRLRRGGNEADLQYYLGYITALARCIAGADGIAPDGVILTVAQIEASRLLGSSTNIDGDYAEGIKLLPAILSTEGAEDGLRDGELDGWHVVDPRNRGPYFGKLRSRFDVQLSGSV